MNDFPSGAKREEAVHHVAVIADYWLEDMRKEMREEQEEREGKRWVVWPHFFHWDKTKPWVDQEGRAVQALEQVHYNDITGPLGEKALFLLGCVKFHDRDYRDADHYFSQLVEMHPNSPFAPKALVLAIAAKKYSTGGADYDGRNLTIAKQMIQKAETGYPELKTQKEEFDKQLDSITKQQAEKDYKIAEFYRRTGHPCSAYFYYKIVLRRYHGFQPYCGLAEQRLQELEKEMEKHPPVAQPSHPAVPSEISLTGWLEKMWKGKPANTATSQTAARPPPADSRTGPQSLPQSGTP